MKYTEEDNLVIIEYVFKVIENRVEINEAVNYLREKCDCNENSFKECINSISCMLDGKKYIRTISKSATKIAYDYIYKHYGVVLLEKALKATDEHIEYYEEISHYRKVGLRKLNEQYWRKIENAIVTYDDEELVKIDFREGRQITIKVSGYERNQEARKESIDYHGCYCQVCGFDFEEKYGEFGRGIIHVHHIKPLHQIAEEYTVNPKTDLIPVCPNCHTVIHKNEERTIEEIRSAIKKNS
ncbi:MAG: HNH endonuclease [Tissierellales bacterium]|nr:HNH endonuclease [Tissierellales bacterium]